MKEKKISIITINRNNVAGLELTMQSVLSQTYQNVEYVVVDGASTDGSVDVIKRFVNQFGERMKWVSEPDTGIYNAMNKGIRMATGVYLQFLNSGDYLTADDVTERMLAELERQGNPLMLYGNIIKCFPDGRKMLDKSFRGGQITMLDMYLKSMNHNATYIHRDLFEKYGLYDEGLKIASDWKWFLQVIVLEGCQPNYTDINILMFDMTGISSTGQDISWQEREAVLAAVLPESVLEDYRSYCLEMNLFRQMKQYYGVRRLVYYLERFLTKRKNRPYKRKYRFRG